jgi:hypothetical protein
MIKKCVYSKPEEGTGGSALSEPMMNREKLPCSVTRNNLLSLLEAANTACSGR